MSKDILTKFKPKTDEEINKEKEEKKQINKDMIFNEAALDAELYSYNTIEDILYNEKTGNPLCVVRRPSMEQWESFIPPEVMKYKNPEDVPAEIARKANDSMFDMMAEIIVKPKHDREWWKKVATQEFITMFQNHLSDITKRIGDTAKKF